MLSLLLIFALTAAPSDASAEASGSANATLPLTEVLRLYHADQPAPAVPASPPVRAAVGKAEMTGRLLDGALEVTAHFEVTVLAEQGWTAVPLLVKGRGMSIVQLPSVEGATLGLVGGQLQLLTDKGGTYSFEVGFRQTAAGAPSGRRRVELGVPAAAAASLRVRYDESLFHLVGAATQDGDGAAIDPVDSRFVVEWDQTKAPKVAAKPRPSVESVVVAAAGSIVSTLAGRTVTRLAYDLRLGGQRPIDFALPSGESLERVYVNGTAVEARAEDGRLHLDIAPGRAGDDTARVELVLNHQQKGYDLSGKLRYELPAVSWSCNELDLTLHLPDIFNYQWAGGTLALVDKPAEEVFLDDIPTPGKVLALHQQLVDQAPSVQVAYSVDLAGSYFK